MAVTATCLTHDTGIDRHHCLRQIKRIESQFLDVLGGKSPSVRRPMRKDAWHKVRYTPHGGVKTGSEMLARWIAPCLIGIDGIAQCVDVLVMYDVPIKQHVLRRTGEFNHALNQNLPSLWHH